MKREEKQVKNLWKQCPQFLTVFYQNGTINLTAINKTVICYLFFITKYDIARTICAFLNRRKSQKQGILLIGIEDNGKPNELVNDFSQSEKGRDPKDFFRCKFDDVINSYFNKSDIEGISSDFTLYCEKDVFVVEVLPSETPVFMNYKELKMFYTRHSTSTRKISDIEEIVDFCLKRWGKNRTSDKNEEQQ